jgi:HEAT repeat protein
MSGGPSLVSLYVLSTEALLDKFLFDRVLDRVHEGQDKRGRTAEERENMGRRSMQNMESMRLAALMYTLASPGEGGRGTPRDWSLEDLQAIERETAPDTPPKRLDQEYAGADYELLQYLQVSAETIPQCIKSLPRLKNKRWYLTKQVWTFRPQEMHDLEFEPAIPRLASTLPDRAGGTAARILSRLGPAGASALITVCRTTNTLLRINASFGLVSVQNPGLVELLLRLLKDDVPQVRFNAVMAAPLHRDERLVDSLIALFRDPYPQIRLHAAQWLSLHEPTNRAPAYIALLHDPDLEVQACALHVLLRCGQHTIQRPDLLRLLGDPRMDVVSGALTLLQGRQALGWTYSPAGVAPRLPASREGARLTSAEAAPLTTNRLTMARLMGLKILRQNADAEAVALTLPLLRDTNSIVRNRAFAMLQTVTGQDIPQTDPTTWEQWWAANKDAFVARKQTP